MSIEPNSKEKGETQSQAFLDPKVHFIQQCCEACHPSPVMLSCHILHSAQAKLLQSVWDLAAREPNFA